MKAAVFSRPGKLLSIESVPEPSPGPDEIVLKVHSCGICGTDVHMSQDNGPLFTFAEGTIPGHEYAGEVAEVGNAVSRFKVGDRICAQPFSGCGACQACAAGIPFYCAQRREYGAGFSEYALVGEQTSVLLDDRLAYDDGAIVEPLAVGLHGARTGAIAPGDNVLVLGAGPIGLSTAFFACRMGAGKLAVAATSRRREHHALAMGADSFLVPEEGQSLVDLAMQEFAGLPDVVLECVGKPGTLNEAMNCVKPHGTVVAMGLCTAPDTIQSSLVMFKEINMKGANTYTIGEFAHVVDVLAAGAPEARHMVTDTISLSQLPDVLETLRGATDQCKVLVHPWE